MALEIAGLLATTGRNPAPPARRGGGTTAPVRIRKLPDGRLAASASYGGATAVLVLPARVANVVQVGGDEVVVGGLFDSIAKGLSALHHSKVVQGVAAGVLAVYGVPPGVTTRAMDMTGDLLDKARAGNPRAKARVQEIGRRARAGEPAAATAAKAILHRNRADRRTRAAMDLLYRAQRGNVAARAAVDRIGQMAASGNRSAATAQQALSAVLEASRRHPAPPVVRTTAARRPPPPAVRAPLALPPAGRSAVLTLDNARVLREERRGGKRILTVQVGGAGLDWLGRQLGYHRGYRPEAEADSLRDLYLKGVE